MGKIVIYRDAVPDAADFHAPLDVLELSQRLDTDVDRHASVTRSRQRRQPIHEIVFPE